MIKIEFQEPSTEEWQEWRRLCEKATRKLCDARAKGHGLEIDEILYKKMRDVYLSLNGPFHGKCAYCESFIAADQPGDIDHFRPKAEVKDVKDEVVRLSGQHSNLLSHPAYSLLSVSHIKDLAGLVGKLSSATPDALSYYLWARIPLVDQTALQDTLISKDHRKSALVNALNTLLQGDSIYETARFSSIRLTPETQELVKQCSTGPSLVFLNRMLLTEAFPKEIAGIAHPGYYWLAYEWSNLLPACAECNRPSQRKTGGKLIGKGTRFPINGEYAVEPGKEDHEEPLLINPASPHEDPSLHIEVDKLGILIPLTDRGAACVRVFGLNDREALVRKRKDVLYEALDAVTTLVDAIRVEDEDRVNRLFEKLEAFKKGSAAYSLAGRTGMTSQLSKQLLKQSRLMDTLAALADPPRGSAS